MIRRLLAAAILALLPAGAGAAQEPIRFPRTPDISPDGKLVAFSYLGDIWVVPSAGGVARQLTQHQAHDVYPCFSPDGRSVAFSSNRHGGYDIFTVSVAGGRPTRLTYDSAPDIAAGWTPDSRNVLFASGRSTAFPSAFELWTVPAGGGAERPTGIKDGKEGAISPKGDLIAYTRGPGTWYRKGYRGSSQDDVWIATADGSAHRRLGDPTCQDTSPMWSPDGKCVYFVTESLGIANIVCQELTPAADGGPPALAGKFKPITDHKDEAVRRAKISAGGDWIVYECGPDIWVVSTKGGSPRKLAIEAAADDKTNPESVVTFTRNATEYSLSADEKYVCFCVHGELFLVATEGSSKAIRLTDHPAYDHGAAWAPDGKRIVFASDRGGHEDLYALEADDPESTEFAKARKFKVTQLTNTPDAEVGVTFSPDGSRVAFVRAGRLWTMKPDGSDPKAAVADQQVIDYDWSPDSKWFAFARMDGSFAAEIYLQPVDGSAKPKNVSRYATWNTDVTWSSTGQKLAFLSERRGSDGMTPFVMSLQKPAAPGAPAAAAGDIDWDDLHLRIKRISRGGAGDCAISPDGSKVAFRSDNDLWVANSDGNDLNRLTNGGVSPSQVRWSKKRPGMIYFLDGTGSVRAQRVGMAGDPMRVNFQAKMTVRREEEFAEMFEQSWRALHDSFYDAAHHGVDWQKVHDRYRPLVKHVSQKEDLYALVSLMIGELNASHLGISGPGPVPEEQTADLGLLWDESYKGPGLRVAEVLKRGPADLRGVNLKAGDVVVAIDRTDLGPTVNLSHVLNAHAGEALRLDILNDPKGDPKDPKNRRRVDVTPVARGVIGDLMYERWVENNAKRVTELSKGTLGYIHIPSMDEAGLERFVRALYSDSFDKDAIVLDVRFNGGGFTHDQVMNYLTGKAHTYFRQRNGGTGLVLRNYDRKWNKPLVLLINQRSYSDAEIFPNAFREHKLGKLVGLPTGGAVIGTSSIRLIDGSQFRVPRIGVWTAKGVNMEKEGVQPDFLVEPTPEQLLKGQDPQLDKAVEVLLGDVAEWKKANPPVAFIPGEEPTKPVVSTPAAGTGPASTPTPGGK